MAPISITPTFQKIILDKGCPTLTKSNDYYLQHDNIFLYIYVFRVIFETVDATESSIVLSEKPHNNKSLLWYGNQHLALGQGDAAVIRKLSEVIKELVVNDDIKKRVEGYADLYKELTNEKKINEVKNRIEELATYIHGGGT